MCSPHLLPKKKVFFQKRELYFYSVFCVVLVYFSWLLRGSHFTTYDNFSHWAVVVKNMLLTDRMPNFEDSLISFQAYPLGSSLFLYYIGKLFGTVDACLIWGQMFLSLSAIFSVTAFLNKKDWYCFPIPVLFGIYSLLMNTGIYDLLVDSLLPLIGTAAVAMILCEQEEPRKTIVALSILSAFLINVKNSGIFFVLIGLIIFVIYHWNYVRTHFAETVFIGILPPAVMVLLWKKHIALVFQSASTSKHSMSLSNYKMIFEGKTQEDIRAIGQKFFKTFVSFDDYGIRILLGITVFCAVLTAIWYLSREKNWKQILWSLPFLWGILFLYQISLLVMYLFSMPLAEALALAGYQRYEKPSFCFSLGILPFLFWRDGLFLPDG